MKGVDIRSNTLNQMREKIRNILQLKDTRKYFVNRTLVAQLVKPTIDKWGTRKIKDFCTTNNTSI